MRRRPTALAALVSASVLVVAACTEPAGSLPNDTRIPSRTVTSAGATATPTRPAPLVVETVFDHTSLDPQRQFERSGGIVAKALYQTLTTLGRPGKTTPAPGLAQYTISPEGNWLTLRLMAGLKFSDGTPITTDDVIFSLSRAQGLRGAASQLLGNITMNKVDDRILTITSPDANFALPAILANPAFGILNSKVVMSHGGTIGPGDTAGRWLETHSAGSGPYVLSAADKGSITLERNPHWSGPAPAHPEVVLRDASPAQQLTDLESGRADIVLDLSPLQAEAIQLDPDDSHLTIVTERSLTVAYLMLNQSAKVNRWTADPRVAEAIHRGIDAPGLARLVSAGATVANGLIPQGIVGALKPGETNPAPPSPPPATGGTATPTTPTVPTPGPPTRTPVPTAPVTPPAPAMGHDAGAARALLKDSSYRGQPIPLVYATDLPIQGVPSSRLAEGVAAQLADVGVKVVPKGEPASKALADYRAGRLGLALFGWTPDFPDPEDYLVFAPGHLLGARAGWQLRQDPRLDELTIEALNSVGAEREAAYGAWQRAMNQRGAFVPLIQPASHFAHGDRVSSLATNPVWTIDLARTR